MVLLRVTIISFAALAALTACGGDGTGVGAAPTAPSNLFANAVSASMTTLSWDASTDDVGVTGYRIYRGGAEIGSASEGAGPLVTASLETTYIDTGLTPGTDYCYTVSALDGDNNESAQSGESCTTTHPAAPAAVSVALDGLRKNFGDPPVMDPPFPSIELADWWYYDLMLKEITRNAGVTFTSYRFCRNAYYYDYIICENGILDGPLYIPAGGEYLWENWVVWQYRVSVLSIEITIYGTDDFGNPVTSGISFHLSSN